MNRKLLFAYQLLTGCSDTFTGILLIVAPAATLQLMHVASPAADLVFVAYIGSFVFAVGLSCLYGAWVIQRHDPRGQLATIWLLTALMRGSVAIFVAQQVFAGTLESGWMPVAVFDGACVLIQAIGLRRNWVIHAAH